MGNNKRFHKGKFFIMIDTSVPIPCKIKNKQGLYYHPTKAPEGLCKCGVMLGLKPRKEGYVFPARIRARHAIEHTIRFLKVSGLPFDAEDFIIENY
jgi:hypothetical protein